MTNYRPVLHLFMQKAKSYIQKMAVFNSNLLFVQSIKF